MKKMLSNIIYIVFACYFITGCSGFLNPVAPGFLDWNQEYLQEQNEAAINSGNVFNGTDEQAVKIGRQCKAKFKDINLYKKCLLENGYKKAN
ncbi:hypothetical protein [uncultured Psychrobacter sp.]|uniref:hypothetical protein n=1 Tax=uncultured Psychrobacter sp. TaxID=259303 RepID=UPI00262D7860|nr:hypothetical protein [uncultured Psychrobacter sp.]